MELALLCVVLLVCEWISVCRNSAQGEEADIQTNIHATVTESKHEDMKKNNKTTEQREEKENKKY